MAQQGTAGGSSLAAFLPIILMFGVIYFLMWRPQIKARKTHEKVLAGLKKGDKILTRGGIYGKIVDISGKEKNKLIIDVGGNTRLTVARSYIAGLAESAPQIPEGK